MPYSNPLRLCRRYLPATETDVSDQLSKFLYPNIFTHQH